MTAPVITVPAFGSAHDGVRHFFGTRNYAPVASETGVPLSASEGGGRTWMLSVKQVHGTDAGTERDGGVARVALEQRMQQRAAGRAVERDDGHTPHPLARQAPIRPIFDHPVDAIPPRCGNPPHPVDLA